MSARKASVQLKNRSLDNNAAERQQRADRPRPQELAVRRREDGGTWAPDLLTVFQLCRLQRLDAVACLSATMPALIAGDVDPLTLTPAVYAQSRRVSA